MTEETYFTEENFNLSYSENQKEMRRILITFRVAKRWSLQDMAEAADINEEKLNKMELGDEKINLLDFARVLAAAGMWKIHLDD